MEKSLHAEDAHQNPNDVLSHGGKIISFSCKRDSALNVSGTCKLFSNSFSFKPESNAFLKAAGATFINKKMTAQADIVKCQSVIDVQRRVRTPCVLVTTKKSERGERFYYTLLTLSSNKLESRVEFKLPYQMKDGVYILQGPTVLWRHDNSVFYTSLQAEGVRKIPFEMSHCIIGELPIDKGQIFVLGLQNLSDPLENKSSSSALGYFLGDVQVFSGTAVLPCPYIGITQCMLALSAEREGDVLKCAVIAATSYKQLVYFENGVVKDTCQLPYDQAEDIQVVDTGRKCCLFVVLFKRGNVCAVWKETFQVCTMNCG